MLLFLLPKHHGFTLPVPKQMWPIQLHIDLPVRELESVLSHRRPSERTYLVSRSSTFATNSAKMTPSPDVHVSSIACTICRLPSSLTPKGHRDTVNQLESRGVNIFLGRYSCFNDRWSDA